MIRALILVALLGAAVALPKKINRIVGGEETTIEEHPFMSNMQYGWFGVIFFQACGGSLLNEELVLSAAHCFEGDSANDWRVRLGSTAASSGGEVHHVSQLILHEGYNSFTIDNDVALVRLATRTAFSAAVSPARIPGPNYVLPDDAVVYPIGWGTTSQGGSASEILRKVAVNVINQQVCAERYAELKSQPGFQNWPDITDGMLCAGILDVGGKDACQGDSGGPLAYLEDIVVGVTSWGYGCANARYPGVNARVSHFSNWILANAQ